MPLLLKMKTAKTGVWFEEIERKLAKLSKTTFTYLSYTQQSKLEKKVRQLKEKSKEVALEHETFLGPCHAGLALEREM